MRFRAGVLTAGSLLILLLIAGSSMAQSTPGLQYGDNGSSYKTVKVADGVYAFIAPDSLTPVVSGNSIAVIGDDGVLVVDSGHFPTLTKKMIAEIRALTDKP